MLFTALRDDGPDAAMQDVEKQDIFYDTEHLELPPSFI